MGTIVTSRRAIATAESILASDRSASNGAGVMKQKPSAPVATAEQETETEVTFVKNTNPRETIYFEDGEKFRFPGSLYVCTDPDLIAKIKKVADRFNIVIQ